MATPLLDHEVLKMQDSDFLNLAGFTLRDFDEITNKNYQDFIAEQNATVHIEDDGEDTAVFKFRSQRVLSCSGTFSFKKGKLSSYGFNIKPQGYFKKRVCGQVYKRTVEVFGQICDMADGKIEASNEAQTKFLIEGKELSVTNMKHPFTGTLMVMILCNKKVKKA